MTEARRLLFIDAEPVETLRNAFRTVKQKRPFHIDAIVIMPDHLHCIWTLPPGDYDYSTRWRLIKTWFTKHCDPDLRKPPNEARQRKQQQAIWQHRYWEHTIEDETDFANHVNYIHYNLVGHKYVKAARDWPYSSFHRDVAAGLYDIDWGTGEMDFEGIGHE